MSRLYLLGPGFLLALLAGCAAPATPPSPTAATAAVAWAGLPPLPALDLAQQRGHDMAVQRCSGCHTVGLDNGGAAEGPAFYTLARRCDAQQLQLRFAQVSAHGFDRMPPITFTTAQASDLVAYFDSLHGN
jgi:mono/diheme cytochrome c family protein